MNKLNDDDLPFVDYEMVQAGPVIPGQAFLSYLSDDILILEINFESKYVQIDMTAGEMVFFGATERSLYLDETKPREIFTAIRFNLPKVEDDQWWSYQGSSCSRYSATIIYRKESKV